MDAENLHIYCTLGNWEIIDRIIAEEVKEKYVCICTHLRCWSSIILDKSWVPSVPFDLSVSFHIYSLEGRNRRTMLIRFSQAIFKHKVTDHIFEPHSSVISQVCFIQVHVSFFESLRKADRKSLKRLEMSGFQCRLFQCHFLSFTSTLCLFPLCWGWSSITLLSNNIIFR